MQPSPLQWHGCHRQLWLQRRARVHVLAFHRHSSNHSNPSKASSLVHARKARTDRLCSRRACFELWQTSLNDLAGACCMLIMNKSAWRLTSRGAHQGAALFASAGPRGDAMGAPTGLPSLVLQLSGPTAVACLPAGFSFLASPQRCCPIVATPEVHVLACSRRIGGRAADGFSGAVVRGLTAAISTRCDDLQRKASHGHEASSTQICIALGLEHPSRLGKQPSWVQ